MPHQDRKNDTMAGRRMDRGNSIPETYQTEQCQMENADGAPVKTCEREQFQLKMPFRRDGMLWGEFFYSRYVISSGDYRFKTMPSRS